MERVVIEMAADQVRDVAVKEGIVKEDKLLRLAKQMLRNLPDWLRGQNPRNVARHFAVRVACYALECALEKARKDLAWHEAEAVRLAGDLAGAQDELSRWRSWYASAQPVAELVEEPTEDEITYVGGDDERQPAEVAQ